MDRFYLYRAIVRSIWDGDSVRLDIDLGLWTWKHNEAIRLYGINAPEIRGEFRPDGLISRNWLRKKLPTGTEVMLKTHRDKSGKYGRLLGELKLPGEATTVNQQMLELGLAEPYKP